MRAMRQRVLILLLCLAIPWQAWAVGITATPCPMAEQMAEQMAAALASGDLSELPDDDCCNDAETFARTGQACQPAQDGHAPGLWMLPAAAPAGPASAPSVTKTAELPAPPGDDLASIWRPPTHH